MGGGQVGGMGGQEGGVGGQVGKTPYARENTAGPLQVRDQVGSKERGNRGPLGQVAVLGWEESSLLVGELHTLWGGPILWRGLLGLLGPGEDGEILARGGRVPERQAGGVGRGQAGTCAAGLF